MNTLSKLRLINIGFWILTLIYIGVLVVLSLLKKIDLKTLLLFISVPLNIAMFLYIKNDKAYLLISKYILRPFFMSSNDWSFSGIIKGVNEFSPISYDKLIKKGIKSKILENISIRKLAPNKFILIFDNGKISLTVEFFPKKNEIHIFSNKFTVADTSYENMLKTLYELLKLIKLSVSSYTEEKYTITIYYDENPYYGFYLKQIPKTFIKDFSLKLAFPSKFSNIFISKNKIQISSKDFEYLREDTKRVLELSELPS